VNLRQTLSEARTLRFIENYDSYYSIIFSSIYSKIGNYHDAEDICQEVFFRFFNKIEEVESPRKWLFGCLRIVVLDYYREKKGKELDLDELSDNIAMSYVNGFRDTRMMIKQAIDEICDERGDTDASLFELVAVYNFTFVQASKHLNLNYKQARYRYRVFTEKVLEKLMEKGVRNIEDLL
jgi:DNA-directed RNA polymerase specialized sigma24 family protein